LDGLSFVTMTLRTEEVNVAEDDKLIGSGARDAVDTPSCRPRGGFEEVWEKRPGRKVRYEVSEVPLTVETELRKNAEASQSLVRSMTRDLNDDEGNRSHQKTNADQPRPDR
jgi:hypothetical protein